jgi:hypothetical protein
MANETDPKPAVPVTGTSLDVMDKVGGQVERMLKLVGEQAEHGVGRFLQVVGGVFLLLGLVVRIAAAMSDKLPRSSGRRSAHPDQRRRGQALQVPGHPAQLSRRRGVQART